MEVKILKPLLASKSNPENLRPVFVGIRADFGNIDPALVGVEKVEVLYVKKGSVPSKGIVKAPHGKTVFWKPSSDTYTVKEPCFAMEDENAAPQCLLRSQAKCIGTSCNVLKCPLRNYKREYKVNMRGLVVYKSWATTYTVKDFAKLSIGAEVMAAMGAAMAVEEAEWEEAKAERVAAKEARATAKAA